MYTINNVSLSNYQIFPSKAQGEGIAMKGIFDLPKRTGDTHFSWAEEDSIEPYVAADELFFEAREIEFYGIMKGTKLLNEINLQLFRELIATFKDLVPFVTPYGTYSVYIKRILLLVKEGVTTLRIQMVEPEVGLVVGEPQPDTIYYSAEYSETAIKNNCQSGFHGSEVTLTAAAGKFTSIISQEAADQLAIDWVRDYKQEYANVNGTCIINPTVYWNTKQTSSLFKNDCALGYKGSLVTYVVEANTYSSIISQEDANNKALAEIETNFTQQYANDNGTCKLGRLFYETENNVGIYYSNLAQRNVYVRMQRFFVLEDIPINTTYTITIYGVQKSYFVPDENHSREDVINGLVALINFTTLNDWNAAQQAPVAGTIPEKPEAKLVQIPIVGSNGLTTPCLEILVQHMYQAYETYKTV